VTLRLAVMLHLFSLVVLAAGGIGGMLMHRPLVQAVRSGSPLLPGLASAAMRLAIAARIGSILMLLSGLNLGYVMHWVDFRFPWMNAKLTIYALMWVLSLGLAAPAAAKLGPALARRQQGEDTTAVLESSLSRLGLFHALILVGFVAIVVLVIGGTR